MRSAAGSPQRAVLRLEGLERPPRLPWGRSLTVVVARSRCRLRWFKLAGLPQSERLSALRLQVEAWRPFDATAARLVLIGEEGLAIAWDDAALHRDLGFADVPADRHHAIPESLLQPALEDGVRLIQGAEGFEAQRWHQGALKASRWWAAPLSAKDWQEFCRSAGLHAGEAQSLPSVQSLAITSKAWARHQGLDGDSDGLQRTELRIAFSGGVAIAVVAGALAQQWWSAEQEGRSIERQMAEIKTTAGEVLAARDQTMAALDDVQKLATWFAQPLPVDVIGQLHESLGRSGIQVKELELEGQKLRLGLQLSPQSTRAGIVRDLQAGGWFTDVTEVRADNVRSMLTMDMRIQGDRPPATPAAAPPAAAPQAAASPAPVSNVSAAAANPVAAVQPPASPPPAPIANAAPRQAPKIIPIPPDAPKPTKDNPMPLPPASVFDAIPNR